MIIEKNQLLTTSAAVAEKLLDFADRELYRKNTKKYINITELEKDLIDKIYEKLCEMLGDFTNYSYTRTPPRSEIPWEELFGEYFNDSEMADVENLLVLHMKLELDKHSWELINDTVENKSWNAFLKIFKKEYVLTILYCLEFYNNDWADGHLGKKICDFLPYAE